MPIVPLVGTATLIIGFGVARLTGQVWLGGIPLIIGGAWCAWRWWRSLGAVLAVIGVLVFFAAFAVSHPFAHVVGAWPSTIICALAAGAVTWAVQSIVERRRRAD